MLTALIREAQEELGILIEAEDVRFVQIMHNSYGIGRIALFFEARTWKGEVANMEPHKCDDLQWFDLANLPDNMVPYIREALGRYVTEKEPCLTLYGW